MKFCKGCGMVKANSIRVNTALIAHFLASIFLARGFESSWIIKSCDLIKTS